jgi:N-acetylmuramic acid 6-phosphate etherase
LSLLVAAVVEALRSGGRLIYLGAGTSGRLGVLDASECPPTFSCDPAMVVGVIAGGDGALRRSSEGAEDDYHGAAAELRRLKVSRRDVVVGIAAGGTTPYVLGALALARRRGSVTALICNVGKSAVLSQYGPGKALPASARPDHLICLPVGPEVLTGSTRMKAGTAAKLTLNMISTAAMVGLGKAWGNLMVDLRASNAKLRDRAARIVAAQCGLTRQQALAVLDRAGGQVKMALVMARRKVNARQAQRLLTQHRGRLRPIIGSPD